MFRKLVLSVATVSLFWATDGCRWGIDRPETGETGITDTQETGPVDTSDTHDSTVDTQETGDTQDSDPPIVPWWLDGEFEVTNVDDETWADDGYVTLTYQLTDSAPGHYDSLLEGEKATFYLLVPDSLEEGEQLDVVVWYHGGAIGYDPDPDNLPDRCTAEKVMGNALKAVDEDLLPTAVARRGRWAVLVPRNDWCDSWLGLGPDDPVDPERHYGYYHVSRMLDFVLAGDVGFQPSGELFGWGTSMGGTAAIIAAHRYAGFTAIIADSPPSSMFLYYQFDTFEDDREIMEHILGGPPFDEKGQPTEWFENYYWNSAETIVQSGEMQVPMYVIWNSQDQLCDPPHVEVLIQAMYTIYPPEVRHGDHDMNHAAPGTSYHTQSTSSYPPWGYSGSLLIDFLEGSWLNWTEAEAGCAGPFEELCTVGSVLDADTIGTIADYSGAAVMMVEGTDGEGTLWCDDLPADLPAGGPITATAILVARSITATSDDSPLLTLNYVEGDNLVLEAFTVGEFLPEGETDLDEAIDQYRATTLEFVPTDVSQGVLCAQVHGDATIYLDSIVYAYAD